MNLYEYLEKPVVVREPATHDDFRDKHVCPECGAFIEESEGPTTTAPVDQITDERAREQLLEAGYSQRFPTFGYRCTRHTYEVLTPVVVSNGWAGGFLDGWAGVPLEFADGAVRHVPVPAKELGPAAPDAEGGEAEA